MELITIYAVVKNGLVIYTTANKGDAKDRCTLLNKDRLPLEYRVVACTGIFI